eukprot:961894-Rhodomonas_salina.1
MSAASSCSSADMPGRAWSDWESHMFWLVSSPDPPAALDLSDPFWQSARSDQLESDAARPLARTDRDSARTPQATRCV